MKCEKRKRFTCKTATWEMHEGSISSEASPWNAGTGAAFTDPPCHLVVGQLIHGGNQATKER